MFYSLDGDKRIKKGEHRQPFVLPDGFEEEALVIRNKLLLWRFRHWKDAKLNPELEINDVASRINEIIIPILSVMHSDTVKEEIGALAMAQQEDIRQQRQSSFEGVVLKAIKKIGFDSGDILPADIKKKLNAGKEDKRISTHKVTGALMKLELKLHKYGNRCVITDCEQNRALLEELYKDYDLTEPISDDEDDNAYDDTEKSNVSLPDSEI